MAAKFMLTPGTGVGVAGSGDYGTFGCFLVKKDKWFGLTNSHVVGQKPGVEIAYQGGTEVIGIAKHGAIRNPGSGIDAAIIEISDDIIKKKKYNITFPPAHNTIIRGPAEATVGQNVAYYGAMSGRYVTCKIVNVVAVTKVSGTVWTHIIEFESGQIVEKGDSGSLLFDPNTDVALGVVFAGSAKERKGFASNIGRVLAEFKSKYGGEFQFPQAN